MIEKILDVCCGPKAFYFDKENPRVLFCDKRDKQEIVLCNGQKIKIEPDIVCDFTNLPFDDNSFYQVIFDPPHLINKSEKAWMVKKYGTLPLNWEETLSKGFNECMRVLKPNGTLIFKWNEVEIKTSKIIEILGHKDKLIFGHPSGKRSLTQWLIYMK